MIFVAQLLADGGSGFGHMDGFSGWWMMLFWVPFLTIGLAVLAVVLLRSGATPGQVRSEPDEDGLGAARRILAERFARGEMTSEEYRERVDQLG